MRVPLRRRPIALLLCCSFASVLPGLLSGAAHAQGATPLRVDPVLLGLPAIEPKAKAEAPVPVAEPQTAEPEPVAAEVVEKAEIKAEDEVVVWRVG